MHLLGFLVMGHKNGTKRRHQDGTRLRSQRYVTMIWNFVKCFTETQRFSSPDLLNQWPYHKANEVNLAELGFKFSGSWGKKTSTGKGARYSWEDAFTWKGLCFLWYLYCPPTPYLIPADTILLVPVLLVTEYQKGTKK